MKARIQKGILTGLLVLLLLYLMQVSSARYYWHDEVTNLLYLSGHRPEELTNKLADGLPKTQAELQQFQTANPEKGLSATLQALVLTSPEPPPLYLILLWSWARLFGNAEGILRLLSTGIWFGFLAAVYRLCHLLFSNQRTGIIAVLLLAFSPRFLPLAFQVWEYGLYALLTALSSYLFLSALSNPPSVKRWLLYGFSLTAGFYTQLFFVTVPLSHLAYGLLCWRSQPKKQWRYFLSTLTAAILLFSPWLYLLWQSPAGIYAWAVGRWGLAAYLSRWWGTTTGLFSAFNLPGGLDLGVRMAISALLVLALASLGGCSGQQQRAFLLAIITVPFSFLLGWDWLCGMRYASVGRFFLPSLMGLVLALAFWLSRSIASSDCSRRWLGYLALASVLTIEIFSLLPPVSLEGKYQGYGSAIPNAAVTINQAEKPLVIGEKELDLLSLSHKAKEDTLYLLLKTPEQLQAPIPPANSPTLFFLTPSSRWQEAVQQAGFQLHSTPSEVLWQLQPQPAKHFSSQ